MRIFTKSIFFTLFLNIVYLAVFGQEHDYACYIANEFSNGEIYFKTDPDVNTGDDSFVFIGDSGLSDIVDMVVLGDIIYITYGAGTSFASVQIIDNGAGVLSLGPTNVIHTNWPACPGFDFNSVHGLNVDPLTGAMYALGNDGGQVWLVEIDPTTGAPICGTAQQIMVAPNPHGITTGDLGVVEDMAIDPCTGDIYFSIDVSGFGADWLFSLPTNASQAVPITSLTRANCTICPADDVDALAFDLNGNLFGSDDCVFFQIDPATGQILWCEEVDTNLGSTDWEGLDCVINRAPITANDDFALFNCGQTSDVLNVLANDIDNEGNLDVSSVTIINPPAVGTAVPNPATGEIDFFFPNTNFTGTVTFTYIVCDFGEGCAGPLCSNEATVTVQVLPCQNDCIIDTDIVDPTCGEDNGSITITVANPGTYVYTLTLPDGTQIVNSTNVQPYTFDDLAAGSYSLLVTGDGCLSTFDFTLSDSQNLSADVDVADAGCDADDGSITVTVTPSGTYTYTLNGPGGPLTLTGPSPFTFTGLAPGTYDVTVTDANNCADAVTDIVINQPETPDVVINEQDTTCGEDNGEIEVFVNPAGTYLYTLTDPNGTTFVDSSSDFPYLYSDLEPGVYVLLIEGGDCPFTQNIIIGGSNALQATADTEIASCGQSDGSITINITSGQAPFTYLWSDGVTTQNRTNIPAGIYSVTITDDNGCTLTLSDIIVPSTIAPDVQIEVVDATCGEDNGEILVYVTPGGTYLYTFTNPGGTTFVDSSPDLPYVYDDLAPGDYHLVVDNGDCPVEFDITVEGSEDVSAVPLIADASCGNDDGSITLTNLTGTAPFTFSWSDGPTSQNRPNVAPGTYSVTITDALGCQTTIDGIIVEGEDPPEVDVAVVDATCGEDNGEIIVFVTPGGTYVYTLTDAGGTTYVDSSPDFPYVYDGMAPGTYSLEIDAGNGCTVTISPIIVGGAPDLEVTGQSTDVTCNGGFDGTIFLNITSGVGPFSFVWSDGAITQNRGGLMAGTYSVTVTDANDCEEVLEFTIGEPSDLEISLVGQVNVTCDDPTGSIDIDVSGGTPPYDYSWSDNPFLNVQDRTGLGAGTYFVTVTDANNCADLLEIELTATPCQIDLELDKSASVTEVNVGDTFTYTVTIVNQGPDDATGVQVFDVLPVEVAYQSDVASTGTYSPATGIWNIGNIANGGSASLTITVEVLAAGDFTNVAQVSAANEDDTDSTPNNNDPTEDDQDEVTVTGVQIDLELEKTVNQTLVNVGDNLTYTLTLTNQGPSDATGVVVTDNLPAGLTYVSSTPAGAYNAATGEWTVGNLNAGSTVTLDITATVNVEGTITNTAEVTDADQPDVDSTPDNDDPTEDDQDEVTIGGVAADLELVKNVSSSTVNVGDNVVWTIVIQNQGGSTATGVEVTDNLPAGLILVNAIPSQGSYAGGLWTVGTLLVGGSATLQLETTVTGVGPYNNIAEVTDADQPDIDSTPNNGDPTEDDQDDATVQGTLIDVELEKTADVANGGLVNVGDQFTYTITVNNVGPDNATSLQVFDALPSGVSYVSSSASVGTYSPATGQWNIGNLAAGGVVTLDITVEVVSAGPIVNVAQVSDHDQTDIDSEPANDDGDQSEDDEDAHEIIGVLIDLELDKTADQTEVNVGDNLTYTLTLTNQGPGDATGVVVTDNLPSGVTYVSSSPAGAYNAATGEWTVGSLTAGSTVTLDITVTIDVEGPITNSAEVTDADQPDVDSTPDNDDDTEDDQDEITIGGVAADLELTKEVDQTVVNVGDEVTFTITVENQGGSNATGVEVGDFYMSCMDFVSADASVGSFNATLNTWFLGNLAVGGSETLEITFVVVNPGTCTNVAEITASDQPDIDSTPNNGDPTEDDQDDASVEGILVDLELEKTVDQTTATVGDIVTFTIAVNNQGPSDATGVEVFDALPVGVSFVNATASAGFYNSGTNVWTIGNLANGATVFLDIEVELLPSAEGTLVNVAQVSSADQPDVDSTPGNDDGDQSEDDEDNAEVTVGGLADLELEKTSDVTTVGVGDQFTWTLTLTNNGPSTATGVVVTDNLPAGVSYVSSSASQGGYNSGTGEWTVGTIAVGDTETLDIVVEVTQAGSITNTAEVTESDQEDPDSTPDNDDPTEDDQDDDTVEGELADVELEKTASATQVNVGDQFTYTITVNNQGPSDATGLQVYDLLPSEVQYISHVASAGLYNAASGQWNIGNLANGGVETLDILVEVLEAGVFRNNAQVSAMDQPDVDSTPGNDDGDQSEDDEDGVDVEGILIDLELDKTADATEVNVGDNLTYTLTLTNQGPGDATGVVVTDNLPSGVTFVSSTGAYNAATGEWTVGSLAAGNTVTIDITVTVNVEGEIFNSAEVTEADQPDVDSTPDNDDDTEDDQDEITIGGLQADLELTKELAAGEDNIVNVGDEVTFVVTIENNGGADATGVEVGDVYMSCMDLVSTDPSVGTYNSATNTWIVGELAAGEQETLQMTFVVVNAGECTNIAQVTASDQPDPDSTPDNDDPTEDDQDDETITALQIDLELEKTASITTGEVGDTFDYTLTLTNQGPSDATGVAVFDDLPAGVSFISSSTAMGFYSDATNVWTVGNLTAGQTVTLTITVEITSAGAIENVAEVSSADQPDIDSTPGNDDGDQSEDDEDGVIIQGDTPLIDLELEKTVDFKTIALGDMFNYFITVTNVSTTDATGVEVFDQLPSGVSFVSYTASQGSYSAGTGYWTIGAIPAGTSVSLQITVVASSAGTIENVAQVSDADQEDVDSTPNNDNGDQSEDDEDNEEVEVETPEELADLELTKTASAQTVTVGDHIFYTLVLENQGPDGATNVTVTDNMPAGLNYVSHATSVPGGYNPATGEWFVTSLASGATAVLTIEVEVTGTGSITNVAQVTESDQDDPDSTPDNDDPTEDDQDDETIQSNPEEEPLIDLELTKDVSDAEVILGEDFDFLITVNNNGPDDATGVSVFDLLPAGLSYLSHVASTGTYAPATGTWTIGSVPAGTTVSLQITVTANQVGVIENVAQVSAANEDDVDSTPNNDNGDQSEDDEDNAEVEVTDPQPEEADLELEKVSNVDQVRIGDNVFWTITLTNNGPADATGIEVTESLPSGVTFVGFSASTGAYNVATGIWTVPSLPNGSIAILTIEVTVNEVGTFTNSVEVTGSDQDDPDSTPDNDDPTEDDQDEDEIEVIEDPEPMIDLEIEKTADATVVTVGDAFTYSITIFNQGPDDATGVVVLDNLPSGVSYLSNNTSAGVYNPVTGQWIIGDLANGETATLLISVEAATAGIELNVAQVFAAGEQDVDSTPNNDDGDQSEDDEDGVTVELIDPQPDEADLELEKSSDVTTVILGENFTYTLTLTNNGPADATNVEVTDNLPSGVSFVGSTPSTGTHTGSVWSVPFIAAGTTATLLIEVTANEVGSITNSAEVTASDQDDPDSTPDNDNPFEDDQDDDEVIVEEPGTPMIDLNLEKTSSATEIMLGTEFDYVLTLTNEGTDDATGVSVLDDLPSSVSYLSHVASAGTFNPSTGLWNIGNVASGETVTLTITVTASALGDVRNTAEVVSAVEDDVDSTPDNDDGDQSEDDEDGTDVTIIDDNVELIDLELDKSIQGGADINVGDDVTYIISVANVGQSDATGVSATDQLPAGVTYVSHDANAGVYNPSTGLWDIGSIASNEIVTLEIVVTIDTDDPIINIAEVTAANEEDVDSTPDNDDGDQSEDDEDSETISADPITPIEDADLELQKSANVMSAEVGDTIEYTIVVTNQGPATATGVTVTDNIPAGTAFVDADPAGEFSGSTWTVGTLAPGETRILTIRVRLRYAGDITNVAEVATSDQNDPDSTPGNGDPSEDDQDGVTITVTEDGGCNCPQVYDPVCGGNGITYPNSCEAECAGQTWTPGPCGGTPPEECGDMTVCTEAQTPITICPDPCSLDDFTIESAETTYHCSVVITGGCIIYTPLPGLENFGQDQITIVVCDNGVCETIIVTVNVGNCTEQNSPPVGVNDSATSNCTAITIDVLANDEDVDGDALSICGITQGSNGTVSIQNGQILYTPTANFEGTDIFSYTVCDGEGNEDTATVTVVVDCGDDIFPCEDQPLTYCTVPMGSIEICPSFCTFDGGTFTIVDVTVTELVSTFNCSTVILEGGDCFRYTPLPAFMGEDQVTVTACSDVDPGVCSTITLTILVAEECDGDAIVPNISPVAQDDHATTNEGTSVTIDILGNDTDGNSDQLTICNYTSSGHGTVQIVNRVVTYTPAPGYSGTDSFIYEVCDGNGGTDMAVVTIDVIPSAPCNADQSLCIEKGVPTEICVDFCGDGMSIQDLHTTFDCSLTQTSARCFRYLNLPAFEGEDVIEVTACNNAGVCETANISINVTTGCGAGKKEIENIVVDVPNLLSPNGDGINDELVISNIEDLSDYEVSMLVFSRMGELVFESDDVSTNSWQGTYQSSSEIVANGTYYYVVRLKAASKEFQRTGYIEVKK